MNAWRCLASIKAPDSDRLDAGSRPARSSLIVVYRLPRERQKVNVIQHHSTTIVSIPPEYRNLDADNLVGPVGFCLASP
jgi:hypothetical protein